MKASWVDGSFEQQISPHDAGFLLGLGVFETIGVFDGALPLWSAHLARLKRDAHALDIPFEPDGGLRGAAAELLAREPDDDIVRITLTAGVGGRPTWCMTTRRRADSVDLVRLHVVPCDTPISTAAVKTTSRAAYSLAMRAAMAAGAADALLVAEDGRVRETTTANVFFWRGEALYTPGLDGSVLPGVGRAALIAALTSCGVSVHESNCALEDVENADGLFVTNAVYGPRPAALPNGDPAPLRKSVDAAWQIATARSAD